MNYIKNKYYYVYINIILRAKQEKRMKYRGIYYENHHIFPKSIYPKYKRLKRNIVLLTAKEHYVCHHLLTKFTLGKANFSMIHAFWGMCNQLKAGRDYKISATVYNNIRQLHAARTSATHKNKVVSQETRDRISFANSGKKRSIEFKQMRREYMLGRPNPHKGEPGWTPTLEQNLHKSRVLSGENNYKFKGYYCTPFGKFASLKHNCHPLIVYAPTVKRWCKESSRCVTKEAYIQHPYLQSLGDIIIGKTFKEIGFWFASI